MSGAQSFFLLLALLLMLSLGDALYGHYLAHCQFDSSDGHDVVYLEQYYFNKKLGAQYNSAVGKIVGYTEEAEEVADVLNNNENFIQNEKWKTDICKRRSQLAYKGLLNPMEPYVLVRPVEGERSKHSHVLMCSAYDFYPKQIKVTWLRDGEEATSDVMSTYEMANGNWLYQLHAYLEFTPKHGEKITCMVEHASFREPKLYDWEPEPDSDMEMIAVGSAGLLLGLLFSAAGFIYYKMKSTERVVVPTADVDCPEENLSTRDPRGNDDPV